jgi:hypothetical protein
MKISKVLISILLTAIMSLTIGTLFAIPVALIFGILIVGSLFIPGDLSFKTVVSNPLIGHSRKSMGNATFTTWKGIDVLKNKAISVANPRTGKQVQQRSAFTQIVKLFRSAPDSIRAGFKKQAVKQSEFNAFMGANLNTAFDMTVPGVATFNPELALFGKGTMGITQINSVVADRSNNTIVVNFSALITAPGQALTDFAVVSAYNEVQKESTGAVTAALRSAASASIPMPQDWVVGEALTVYLSFTNSQSGESADSQYLAASIVA